MMFLNYSEISKSVKKKALRGNPSDIESIMSLLEEADLPTTKIIDFHLSKVINTRGIEEIAHFLFHGSQIQRNYCTLFFARRNEWDLVNKAYQEGLIDWKQAYSR